ncbi:VaFE repeat-containing surface-anchored protein [Microbacterium sp. M]|uniref:VaFE repeat-containing surface-anchored protein n=1 Tax=Microbacterium sp. M TaxID=3377125 RepID=UPI00386F4C76
MARAGAWIAATAVALGALAAPTAATAAPAVDLQTGDTVYIGDKEGYSGTGIFPLWPGDAQDGDPLYWAYCLENQVSAETGLTGQVGDLGDYLGSNYFTDPAVQGKVLWVLANSYPALSLEEFGAAVGVPDISRNDAIEATQYAIWRYTDLTFDASWAFETPDSEAAYWYLVNGANASSGLNPEDLEVTASVEAPTAPQTADSLVGPFVVATNQPTASVVSDPDVAITDAAGTPIDTDAVVDGQEVYLDLRGTSTAGSATITVSATGSSNTGSVISVPTAPGGTPTAADHAQTIVLVTPHDTTTTAQATAEWTALAAVPAIGTSLVDSADGDRVLPWNGGTVTDTVAFRNLTPGTEYTLTGELFLKADGSATGITGSTTFTPAEADGSVDVSFVVPEGFAGDTLVAFERLFEGDVTGDPVAVHEDINDAAQTVTVEEAPVAAVPAIGTSLVDSADGDRVLPWNGGTVTDTVAFRNLTPGTEYTLTGELILKADGSTTGITGSTTFTPDTADGSVDVSFVIPEGFAGDILVAFERLYVGDTTGDPVAVHEDINDAAQTVTIEEAPVAPVPAIGTSLVDSADGDRVLSWNGGTVIDTVAYQNLTPGTEYTLTGELFLKADGSATGITGSTTFTPAEADGSVDVSFVVPEGFAGDTLVAFERLFEGDVTGDPVAVHEDINDAAQTVTVEEAPVAAVPAIGTSLVDSADGDRVLPWNGGTVTDTVAFRNLTPGTEYTLTGELILKADGSTTGITGSTTFTPDTADGSVDVSFVIPEGFAGDILVAFERLYVGDTTGDPVAVHEDINDAAQTVTIEEAPVAPVPAIGTSLVDSADGDRVLPWNGGTVTDTVAFRNLTPGTEYTLTGELFLKADGSATGITGSTTFTPAEADGSVDVSFVVPEGFAGDTLVAFERLFEGDVTGDPVAVHEDINDAAQTVTVEEAPVTPTEPTEPSQPSQPTGPNQPATPSDPVTGQLPETGATVPLVAIGASGILLALGLLLLRTRRARSES